MRAATLRAISQSGQASPTSSTAAARLIGARCWRKPLLPSHPGGGGQQVIGKFAPWRCRAKAACRDDQLAALQRTAHGGAGRAWTGPGWCRQSTGPDLAAGRGFEHLDGGVPRLPGRPTTPQGEDLGPVLRPCPGRGGRAAARPCRRSRPPMALGWPVGEGAGAGRSGPVARLPGDERGVLGRAGAAGSGPGVEAEAGGLAAKPLPAGLPDGGWLQQRRRPARRGRSSRAPGLQGSKPSVAGR